MNLVDDILCDQRKLLMGDILIFYGKGHNCTAKSHGLPMACGQFFLKRSGWSRNFLHTAVCIDNVDGVVKIAHIKDTGLCDGNALIEERDLVKYPFRRTMVVIRPPASIRNQVALKIQEGVMTGVRTSKKAYFKAIFGNSRPLKPVKADHFEHDNTCVGFIVNVLQLVYQNETGLAFPLSTEIATAKLLKHMCDLNRKNELVGWELLLIPHIPMQGNGNTLVDYIISFAENYSEGLNEGFFKHPASYKQKQISEAISCFREQYLKEEKYTFLEQVRGLLKLLKPTMEMSRTMRKSSSFEKLLKSLRELGFEDNDLGAKKHMLN